MVKRGVKKAYRNTRQRIQDSFVTSMHEKATTGAIAANRGTTVARAGLVISVVLGLLLNC